MISFQRLLGREAEFFALLEASAEHGAESVAALKRITTNPSITPTLDEFAAARRADKEIVQRMEAMLVEVFITPIEREDIELLAERLYKIPKTIEKFAERYLLTLPQTRDVDFREQVELLEKAMTEVLGMIRALRAANFRGIQEHQSRLQAVENEADRVLLQKLSLLYAPGFPTLKAIILKDLFDLAEKAVDRCRDVGNLISLILLRNS